MKKLARLAVVPAALLTGGCAAGRSLGGSAAMPGEVSAAAAGRSIEPIDAADPADATLGTSVYPVERLIPASLGSEQLVNARGELRDAISSGVGDDTTWLDGLSTISFVGDRMVVKTTPANHARIANLLAALGPIDAYGWSGEPDF